MRVSTKSAKAAAAQVEAFDRILSNHMLYCTVCDNNNGNCTVHNTTKMLAIEHAAAIDFLQAFGRHLQSTESQIPHS
jgi:predicted molibdopterin-dependent oxidoreductase YjgC